MYRNVKRPIIVNGSADDSLEKYVEHIKRKFTLHTQEETYEGVNNNQSPIALTLIDRCQRPSPQPKLGQQPQLVNEWTERTAACQSIQRTAKSTGCTMAGATQPLSAKIRTQSALWLQKTEKSVQQRHQQPEPQVLSRWSTACAISR